MKSFKTSACLLFTATYLLMGCTQVENPAVEKKITAELSTENYASILNDPVFEDMIFKVGPRYWTMTKTKLLDIRTFDDIIGEEHASRIVSYKDLKVYILKDNEQKTNELITKGGNFSPEQLELFKNATFESEFFIEANYTERTSVDGDTKEESWTPYVSVVPEVQAEYSDGNDELIDYLKTGSADLFKRIDMERWSFGIINFTVTTSGDLTNFKILASSGNSDYDDKIIELLKNSPGKWKPGQDKDGQAVDQKLVLTFPQAGC